MDIEATIGLSVMTGTLLVVFIGFLIWGIKSGQFKNVEEPKYQIFRRPADEKHQQPPKEGE